MAIESKLDVVVQGKDELSPVLSQIESRLIRTIGAISSAVAAVKIGGYPIAATAQFEREMANVQKTTEFTGREIDQLGRELLDLSTRVDVGAVDLAKIAAAAGQQGLGGVGVEGIRMFTDSVSRMASVLDITADQAANDIGKILNIFKVSISEVEKVSSAFNLVSNNSTASGEELLDIVKRIGDAAGTINLQQSLGLAATGIDFGMSPEVVGTSFATVFANMRSKAEDFAKLMKVSATEWITTVDNDGIDALEKYLKRLRELDSASQAAVIGKLSGQGRIFALMNKLVQDPNNDLLRRNIENGKEGFATGTSSINEQQKVLNTLSAQATMLKNSMFALANQAGNEMVGGLATYVAQLNAALQQPGVQSFVAAMGKGAMDLIDSFAKLVKVVADMNINWENFIVVLKVFLAIKAGEAFLLLAQRIPLIGTALKSISNDAKAAKVSLDEVANSGGKAASSQLTHWQNLQKSIKEHTESVSSVIAKRRTAESTMIDKAGAENAAALAGIGLRKADEGVSAAAARRNYTKAAIPDAVQTGARDVALMTSQRDSLLVTATEKREKSLAEIEEKYQGARSKKARAAKAEEITVVERHYRRSEEFLTTIYARRIALAEANAARMTAIAKAEAAAAEVAYAQSQASRAAAMQKFDEAQTAVIAKTAAANNAASSLSKAEEAAKKTGTGFATLGSAARVAARGVALLAGGIMNFVAWGTIIYSVLDSFGLIEKIGNAVGPMWNRLTDAVGLSTEADRKKAQEQRELSKAMDEHKKKVQELIDKYGEYSTVTGELDDTKIKGLAAQIKSGGEDAQKKAIVDQTKILEGAREKAFEADLSVVEAPAKLIEAQNKAAKIAVELATAQERLTKAQTAKDQYVARTGAQDSQNAKRLDRPVQEAQSEVTALTTKYKAAMETVNTLNRTALGGISAAGKAAQQAAAEMEDQISSQFTPKSAELFKSFVMPIQETKEEIVKLGEERAKLMAGQAALDKDDPLRAQNENKIAEYSTKITELNGKLGALQDNFRKARTELKSFFEGNPIEAAANAFLNRYKDLPSATLQVVETAIDNNPGNRNGSGAPPAPNTDTKGNDPFKLKNTGSAEESEATKLAKAKFQLAKARIVSEAAFQKEVNNQQLTEEQRFYDKGLSDISTYFDRRRSLLTSNNQQEILVANQTMEELRTKRKSMKKESDRVLVDAEIERAQGELRILNEQKKQIDADIAYERQMAESDFRDRMRSTDLDLTDTLGTENLDDFFSNKLEDYAAQYREFMTKLANSGDEDAKVMLKKLQATIELKAVTETVREAGRDVDQLYSSMDRTMSRLEVLRSSGKITSQEQAALAEQARAVTITAIEAKLVEQQLKMQLLTTENMVGTSAYKKLAGEIDDARIRLLQLKNVADETAQSLNASIEDGVANAFGAIFKSNDINKVKQVSAEMKSVLDNIQRDIDNKYADVASLKRARLTNSEMYKSDAANVDAQIAKGDAALSKMRSEYAATRAKSQKDDAEGFLAVLKKAAQSFAQTLRDVINRELAQTVIRSVLGGGGNGGIGGFFSGILKGATGARGETPANPVFVSDALKAASEFTDNRTVKELDLTKENASLDQAQNALKKGVGDTFDKVWNSLSTGLNDFGNWLSSGVNAILKSISNQSMGGGGGGILGSLISMGIEYVIGDTMVVDTAGTGSGQLGTDAFGGGRTVNGVSIRHGGGVIGSAGVTRDNVDASLFAYAERYHTGGIAGLAPDEVPTILRKGEEVLTGSDPRHRANGGMAGGDTNVEVNVNVESGEANTVSDSKNAGQLGKLISDIVVREITNQKRPGGLLS